MFAPLHHGDQNLSQESRAFNIGVSRHFCVVGWAGPTLILSRCLSPGPTSAGGGGGTAHFWSCRPWTSCLELLPVHNTGSFRRTRLLDNEMFDSLGTDFPLDGRIRFDRVSRVKLHFHLKLGQHCATRKNVDSHVNPQATKISEHRFLVKSGEETK